VSTTPRWIDAGVGIGEIFLEKYRVDSILGHGGMGVVALCTHLALNERVAIKMLRRDVLDDADAVERFMREAQSASKLKSEYVARVTDVGRSPTDVPYMVMEYLEGHDLGALLEDRGRIGLPWAVELTLQACEALAEAHSIGIVHRDIKPTNLFVTWRPDGSALIKVLDFGISKATAGTALELTQTQSLLGTPAYMSPEQMRSARMVDARSDIWSLGTVLYELLEGHRPFVAESFSEMCVKVAADPPVAMKRTPLALQQVVLRCLAKQPEQRYASMAELGAELVRFANDPHQAQVLVDRMTRTLLRSQIADWDGPNHGAPPPLRTTADIRAELGGATTQPIPPIRESQIVTIVGLPSDTLAVQLPGRRQRAALIAVIATVAASLAIVLALSHSTPPAAIPVETEHVAVPEPAAPPAAEPPVAAPAPAPVAPEPAPPPTETAVLPDPAPGDPEPPAVDVAEPTRRPAPAKHSKAPPRRGLGAREPSHPEARGRVAKPRERTCDVFADPHAANACPPGETDVHEN
jgi:serine/threonine-protein kinase